MQQLGGFHTLLLQCRKTTGEDGFGNRVGRHAQFQSAGCGPQPSPLLARRIQHLVHKEAFPGGIGLLKNVAGDFNQVTRQFALIPLMENFADCIRFQPQQVFQ